MSFRESTYQPATTRNEARTLFAHTMSLVAITAAFFAGGAYLGRDLSRGAGIIWLIAAFACLIGIRFAVARSEQLSIGRRSPSMRRPIRRPSGRPAARPPSSSPASAPPAMRRAATSRRWLACSSSR